MNASIKKLEIHIYCEQILAFSLRFRAFEFDLAKRKFDVIFLFHLSRVNEVSIIVDEDHLRL